MVKCAIALSFLAIPTGRFIYTYPTNVSLAVGCSTSGHQGLLTLTDLDSVNCDFKSSNNNLSLSVEECGYLCFDSQSETQETKASLPSDWPLSISRITNFVTDYSSKKTGIFKSIVPPTKIIVLLVDK